MKLKVLLLIDIANHGLNMKNIEDKFIRLKIVKGGERYGEMRNHLMPLMKGFQVRGNLARLSCL